MLIPVGLIRVLLEGQQGALEPPLLHQFGLAVEEQKFRERAHEMWAASTTNGGLVILGNVDFRSIGIDQVAVGSVPAMPSVASGGQRDVGDGLGPGPHGFLAVCPGRHDVATMFYGRPIATSFIVFPREAVFLRFDWERGEWARFTESGERAILERAGRADLSLFDYAAIVQRRFAANAVRSAAEALADGLAHTKSAVQALLRGDEGSARRRVELAAGALLGAPVLSFEPITTLLGFHAFEFAEQRQTDKARAVLTLGLALLPDHPTLLAIEGELLLEEGSVIEGRKKLERALLREVGLDDRLRSRVRELLET